MSAAEIQKELAANEIETKVAETLNDTLLVSGQALGQLAGAVEIARRVYDVQRQAPLYKAVDLLHKMERDALYNPHFRDKFQELKRLIYEANDIIYGLSHDGDSKHN